MCMVHFPELLPRGYYRSILNWSMYYTNEKIEVCEQLSIIRTSVPFVEEFNVNSMVLCYNNYFVGILDWGDFF